jgi:hypothetical protein
MLRFAVGVLCGIGSAFGQASFTALRSPGINRYAYALSGDGRIIIGVDSTGPLKWIDGEVSALGFYGFDISEDGRVIIGTGGAPENPPATAPVYSQDGVLRRVPVPSSLQTGYGYHVSGDGLTLYGRTPWTDHPFGYFLGGFVSRPGVGGYMLERLDDGLPVVDAMSRDGRIMIGTSYGYTFHMPTRWDRGAASRLEPPAPGLSGATYSDLSSDGSVLIGTSAGATRRVFRQLGTSVRVVAAGADAGGGEVSGDGWRIVGGKGTLGFAWDPLSGTMTFRAYMRSFGFELPSSLSEIHPFLISSDGSTVVVQGEPSQLFVARLPRFCYANCDRSRVSPVLNVEDFNCFVQKFRSGLAGNAADAVYANCDNSTAAPMLDAMDLACFMNHYTRGCP